MEIAEIKSRLSIGQVLDHYGIKVNKNPPAGGRAFMVNCPFHDDKKPSMQVYPETNTVHCFSGNCARTGKAIDQIDFILHMESRVGQPISKHEAILIAKRLIGVAIIDRVSQKHLPAGASEKAGETKTDLTEIFTKLQEGLREAKQPKPIYKNGT